MDRDPLYGWPDTITDDEDEEDNGDKEPREVNSFHTVSIEGFYFPRKKPSAAPKPSGGKEWREAMVSDPCELCHWNGSCLRATDARMEKLHTPFLDGFRPGHGKGVSRSLL